MGSDVSNQKRALRAEIRERRKNTTEVERAAAAAGITRNLVDLTVGLSARSASCYLSTPYEPNTRPFLNWARKQGIKILLPISRDDGLLDWTTGDGETETTDRYGLPEPVGELLGPIAINNVDLIIVPAAAVDKTGLRMGWGRGYFDKTLGSMEKRPPVYAVIYDGELVDAVPRELHDQPVDGAVTPAKITEFG